MKQIKFLLIIYIIQCNYISNAQCNIIEIQSTNYSNSECSNYTFQSLIGSIVTSSGNCNGLSFNPPISVGNDILSNQSGSTFTYDKVYPNPFLDIITLDIQESVNGKIIISDCLGQIHYSFYGKIYPKIQLNLSKLQSGYYNLITITNGNQINTHKLIKL